MIKTGIEKDLIEIVTKFTFDFMRVKQNFMRDSKDENTKERQIKLLLETIKYYSRRKKVLLDEEFETKKIFEITQMYNKNKNDVNGNADNEDNKDKNDDDLNDNNCDASELPSSSSSDTHDSDTESEYAFSDVDETDTQKVNRLMACAGISLRRARQSKIGLYLNKKMSV